MRQVFLSKDALNARQSKAKKVENETTILQKNQINEQFLTKSSDPINSEEINLKQRRERAREQRAYLSEKRREVNEENVGMRGEVVK